MSAGSLDILRNRVESAVEETKILRAENVRLKTRLGEVIAKSGTASGNLTEVISRDRLAGNGLNLADISQRLLAVLKRVDRLEKRLNAQGK
jgi:predicted TIM-barrel enzyme